jgi:hypothetical protein
LNDYVYFELSEEGNDILKKYLQELSELTNQEITKDVLVKVNEKGFEYMQLWEFMRIFGDHMMNGQHAVVKSNNVFFE